MPTVIYKRKSNELDKVVDKLKSVYGDNIIKKASQIKF